MRSLYWKADSVSRNLFYLITVAKVLLRFPTVVPHFHDMLKCALVSLKLSAFCTVKLHVQVDADDRLTVMLFKNIY